MYLTVKFKGGLGNQLFQYAFARQSQKLNTKLDLVFDVTNYLDGRNSYSRHLLIEKFLRSFKTVKYSRNEFQKTTFLNLFVNYFKFLQPFFVLHSCKKVIFYIKLFFCSKIHEDYKLGYIPNFQKIIAHRTEGRSFFLEGYFSDFRYLHLSLDELKSEIQLREIDVQLEKVLVMFSQDDIMIHVRRGDYLLIGNSDDGIFIGMDYYIKAITFLTNSGFDFTNRKIWIFSDDLSWCKMTFPRKFPVLNFCWDSEALSDEGSFEFMRFFNFRICANSTFSLWAYYLSYCESSINIFPKTWIDSFFNLGYQLFPDNSKNYYTV
jgi:hypothetical protein